MRLTADYSHWVNVAEWYLADQLENVHRAIAVSDQIHCRVGHPQGPQVNDPRAPEWQDALETHARWWDAIRARMQKADMPVLTITCEFGPAGYLPILPYTQQPVASQWDINVFIKEFLKKRWEV
ncbi:MAG: xylose isomerase [Spirosoma sp.]|nr:xylose isomerase [Spirosoma sp.]